LVESLRERQKERRQRLILDTAARLIGEKGLDDTTIQEIAAGAEVGVATVYNYFGSKNDLLLALLIRYIEEEADLGEAVLRNPPDDMTDGFAALFGVYLLGMVERIGPRLMQEFMSLALSRQLRYGQDTYEMKLRYLDQCRRLAAFYRDRGQARDDVTVDEVAMAYYSSMSFLSMMVALGRVGGIDTMRQMMRRQLSLVASGIARRN